MIERHRLTDAQWERIASLVPGKPGDPGRHGENNRRFVDAILWLGRTGVPWRDLPAEFGDWNAVFRRFSRWGKSGVWSRILEHVSEDPDLESVIIDATIVRAHQHSAGGKGGPRLKLSAARVAVRPPKSTLPSTRSAIRCALSSRRARSTTARKPRH